MKCLLYVIPIYLYNTNKMNFDRYKLIGIGDFSHGINEIWTYRLHILDQIIKAGRTPKIFMEDISYGPKNIMDDKKISVKINKYEYRESFTMMRYTGFRIHDSPIYLKFIKTIKKHNIEIIGVDSGDKYREKKMADNIIDCIENDSKTKDNSLYTYLFFGHNFHIDDRHIHFSSVYKYTTGHYLKKKYANEYCIMLTCGLGGSIRFDGVRGTVSRIPVQKRYTINKNYLINIMKMMPSKKYPAHLPIVIDKNDIVGCVTFPTIVETGWSFEPNWTKENLVRPSDIDLLAVFRHTTALTLF